MAKQESVAENPLQWIKGIGPKRAKALSDAGITTLTDLIFYLPRSYIDRAAMSSIRQLAESLDDDNLFAKTKSQNDIALYKDVCIVGKLTVKREHTFSGGRRMLSFILSDDSGATAKIIFWNMIQYFGKVYSEGDFVSISGKPDVDGSGYISFSHPEMELISPEDADLYRSGSILPKYPLTQQLRTAGVNTRVLRNIISHALDSELKNLKETLPVSFLNRLEFPDIVETVKNLHFPSSREMLDKAVFRIKFEELFFFEILIALQKKRIKNKDSGIKLNQKSPLARKFIESLPFTLTGDQKKVMKHLVDDFISGKPMNRLLQGDVGSGKTVVAVAAMLAAVENGLQTAIMAPTEILAEQHFHTIRKFVEPLGVRVVQLVGGQKAKQRRMILESISSGEAQIIVGTHALFQSEIEYRKLGFIVIDEQHRFGVQQRADLIELGRKSFAGDEELSTQAIVPHILVMSATPIPRTLTMTLYGDLDVSIIRELPKNRKQIITKVSFESKYQEIYDFVKKHVSNGRQVFIVYPLVDESEKMELKAATVHFETLKSEVFPAYKCGLLHGQMLWYEKEDTMKAFLKREYDILVATTVIEVGIDIPNATIMIIENADRFGLSQLHQLRGRVGRGSEQSYCILVTKDKFQYLLKTKNKDSERKAAIIRLKTMEATTDGFEISEVDLKLRGPGDVLGTRQSGLPEFKYADLTTDGEIIELARKEAFAIIDSDPHLRLPEHTSIREHFIKLHASGKNYFDIA